MPSIVGGQVLTPAGLEAAVVRFDPGGITAIERSGSPDVGGVGVDREGLDATGALVLPGIVDLHGDAFERALMPRGGVRVDPVAAIADNDAALLAAGITTAYLSVTDSWEPGLRSRETLHALVAANERVTSGPERRIHVRHERCNTDDIDQLAAWIRTGAISLLSYNDHTPGGIAMVRGISPTQVDRAGVSHAALEEQQAAAIERRSLGLTQEEHLAEICAAAGCVTASHDASGASDLERDRLLGVAIAEFPMSVGLAREYLAAGIDVMLGCPNLVRGGSHLGNLSVRDAIGDGIDPVLCSDYHYPSLLRAPFVLADHGLRRFEEAWELVSSRPASAVGLADRGRIEVGARADLIVVEPPLEGTSPRVRAVVVDGRVTSQVAPG